MATKRMFSLDVIDTDRFCEMPVSSQALYFHLGCHADDEGFVGSPRKILRSVGCSVDDLGILAVKGFVIIFESGVLVITDWHINNTIQADRRKATIYQSEKEILALDSRKKYGFASNVVANCIQDVSRREAECIQSDSNAYPQYRLDKISVDKSSKKESITAATPPAPELDSSPAKKPERHKYGQYGWVRLTDEEYTRLLADLGEEELQRCIRYVDESAQQNGNKNKWRDWNLVLRKCHRQQWGLNGGRSNQRGGGLHGPVIDNHREEIPHIPSVTDGCF